ncbi:MAG: hypothetical protein ACRC78_07930 [Planktothrix sp.]
MSLIYLLDTNIISESMRPIPNPQVVERLRILVLVTNNVSDFQDFDGLKIENWFNSL